MSIDDLKRRQRALLEENLRRLEDHHSGRVVAPRAVSGESHGIFWTRVIEVKGFRRDTADEVDCSRLPEGAR